MFERFTQAARDVVASARAEARQLSHNYIGTEHLLLGILAQPSGAAVDALRACDLDLLSARREVARMVGTASFTLGDDEAQALSAIGIDLDAVRAKLEHSFGDGVLDAESTAPTIERTPAWAGMRFTRRAKKSLELALREARHLRHNFLGPEHLLLGLIREADGIAAQILASKEELPTLRLRVIAELNKAA
jgi:ATP-dependent Clp protease ATP-binding subunit ClpA